MMLEYAAAPLNPEGMKVLLVFLDQPLLWALRELQQIIKEAEVMKVHLTACSSVSAKKLIKTLFDIHNSSCDHIFDDLSKTMKGNADGSSTIEYQL